jgi:hypothetical protein
MGPGNRGVPAAAPGAAELISAIRLPGIERFCFDGPGFAGLPGYAPFEDPSDMSAVPRLTKVDVVRAVMDECAAALAAVQVLEAQVAGCKAALVEKFHAAARVEDAVLGLDRWQSTVSVMSARAEIAAVLTIGEGAAGVLIEHSLALVRDLPVTWGRLRDGDLSWGHAVVVAEETGTLRGSGIPAESIQAYEVALLGKAQGCTVPSFRDKARRLREKSHPESITTRTRAAYGRRRMEVQRVQDGMSWLNVHLPAPTVEGIWDQCTFLARNAQGPGEPRTLTQLRADIAATLLLGQSLSANGINDHRTPPAPAPAPAPVIVSTPRTDSPTTQVAGTVPGREPRTATGSEPGADMDSETSLAAKQVAGTAMGPKPGTITDPVTGPSSGTAGASSESGGVHVPAAGVVGFPGFDPTGTVDVPVVPEDYARDLRLLEGRVRVWVWSRILVIPGVGRAGSSP